LNGEFDDPLSTTRNVYGLAPCIEMAGPEIDAGILSIFSKKSLKVLELATRIGFVRE